MTVELATPIAKSSCTLCIEGEEEDASSILWFKTPPLDERFCLGASTLRLITESFGQDCQDSFSILWFELGILSDENAVQPETNDGCKLIWWSHYHDLVRDHTKHIGISFDRRHKIFSELKVGDVIGVFARGQVFGSTTLSAYGELVAEMLPEEVTPPKGWDLTLDIVIHRPRAPCSIEGLHYERNSMLWFKTTPLQEITRNNLAQLQLITESCDQGWVREGTKKSCSWFELCILSNENSTEPRILNGKKLAWQSHYNEIASRGAKRHYGVVFNRSHEVFKALEVCRSPQFAIQLGGSVITGFRSAM